MLYDPRKPYIHFAQVFEDGHVIFGNGKIPDAFRNYDHGRGGHPFHVEIVSSHVSADDLPKMPRKAPGRPPSFVQCVETGAVFRSQSELAMSLGVAPANVSSHLGLRNDPRSIKGLHFRRVDRMPSAGFVDPVKHVEMVQRLRETGRIPPAPKRGQRPPRPGSVAAMTETERGAARALARRKGFEPRF